MFSQVSALTAAILTAILLVTENSSAAFFLAMITITFISISLFRNLKAVQLKPETPLQPTKDKPLLAFDPSDCEAAAVLMFMRVLQEKSRLLDFALSDITRLPDQQVGAAARVVHQGLRKVLNDSFDIAPIASENEGQSVQLPDDFDNNRYRLLMQQAGGNQTSGILTHRGWEALTIRLPKSTRLTGDPLPKILAPAEIESHGVSI